MKSASLLILSFTLSIFLLSIFCQRGSASSPSVQLSSPDDNTQGSPNETPVPDSGYNDAEDESPDLFEFFRRFIITATPTVVPKDTPTPTITPTRTPRPTPTPVIVPPPTNPDYIRLMIGFGFILIAIVVIGVWINRADLK